MNDYLYLIAYEIDICIQFDIFAQIIFFLKQIIPLLIFIFTIGIANGQNDTVNKTTVLPEKKIPISEITRDEIKETSPKDTTTHVSSIFSTFEVDSVRIDSLRKDSLNRLLVKIPIIPVGDTITYEKYYSSAWLPFHKTPVFEIMPERKTEGQELIFYILTGLVGLVASIRLIFPKYFKNLFLLFMQTTIRQKQTRDQLLQNNLASVFLNVLFIISTGFYVTLLVQYKQWANIPFYQLLLYSISILFVVYLGKYIFLAFSGWVFNVAEATNSYTFIVFLVNKVLGIVLMPFILLITFSPAPIKQVAITISAGVALLLFAYRYMISFGVIRSNLKVSALHFFLYLCAVELLPIVLIYKLLVNFVTGSI